MSQVIRCLVVDDDSAKVAQIRAVVTQEFGDDGVEIMVEDTVYDAAAMMRTVAFDLLIIDLYLPMRKGEAPNQDGGRRLLRQVSRGSNGLIRPSFVVGVTAFEDLAQRNLAEFHTHGWALVSYEANSMSWEQTIANQCRHVAETRRRYIAQRDACFDVAICTALAEPELAAVVRHFSAEPVSFRRDTNRYQSCYLRNGGRSCSVIAASAIEMGTAAMAALTTKMLCTFRPRLFILTGICAGIRSSIGDIVVAESALNYESGKWCQRREECEAVFAPEPRYLSASARALSAVRQFRTACEGTILALPAGFRGTSAPKQPELNVGPVACGAAVIESRDIVDELSFQNRKLEGLEMESYGFYLACRSGDPSMDYVMIKAVCDSARPPKEDRYQEYASYLSASTAYEFIKHELTCPGGVLGLGSDAV